MHILLWKPFFQLVHHKFYVNKQTNKKYALTWKAHIYIQTAVHITQSHIVIIHITSMKSEAANTFTKRIMAIPTNINKTTRRFSHLLRWLKHTSRRTCSGLFHTTAHILNDSSLPSCLLFKNSHHSPSLHAGLLYVYISNHRLSIQKNIYLRVRT